MRLRLAAASLALLGLSGAWAATGAAVGNAETSLARLTAKEGRFYLDGKPYRGLGVNYFDAFLRVIGHNGQGPRLKDQTWRDGFATLKEYEIPFVRLPINGFYPADWKLYMTQKEVYFAQLDALVQEAEKQNIGLIPCFFWTYFTLPDVAGETYDQWAQPQSKTRQLMRQFTREVVERYRRSPAIWAWEFGNEHLNEADLPGTEYGFGWIAPRLGTPGARGPADKVRRELLLPAYVDFAQTIRALDPTRPISTGDTLPRPSAWHLAHEKNWTTDSPEQWTAQLLADNPDPIDTLSGRFYYYDVKGDAPARAPGEGVSKSQRIEKQAAFSPQQVGIKNLAMREQIKALLEISQKSGKPLFVGEFGTTFDLKDGARRQREFQQVLQILEEEPVSLAAIWVFDCAWQPMDSVTPVNDNAYILEALRQANRRLHPAGK